MKLVPAKCPNCGANINVDEEQETTKCEYCGDAILIDKAIQKYQIEIKVTNMPDIDNYLVLAERCYNDRDYFKAYEYYEEAVKLDPNNYMTVLKIGISKALADNYKWLNMNNLNCALTNSVKLADKDKEKYESIVGEMLKQIGKMENKLKDHYEETELNIDGADTLNDKCIDMLTVLENVLSVSELIDDTEQTKQLLTNAIEFIEFIIKPKKYKVKRSGKSYWYSLKLKRKERKNVYELWNKLIDKYNNMSEEK